MLAPPPLRISWKSSLPGTVNPRLNKKSIIARKYQAARRILRIYERGRGGGEEGEEYVAAFRSNARRNARLGAERDRYGFAGIPRVSGRVKREESSTAAHTYIRPSPHVNTDDGEGEGGSRGGGQFLPLPPPSVPSSRYYPRRVDDKWRGCHRSPPLSYASDTTRTLYTNDSVRRVLYDFVVLRATVERFSMEERPVANEGDDPPFPSRKIFLPFRSSDDRRGN